jgi:hypothetical protein
MHNHERPGGEIVRPFADLDKHRLWNGRSIAIQCRQDSRLSPYFARWEIALTAHSLIFRDIAMVFAASFFCGLIAWRLRQPILLGYLLAGLLLSPLTPGPHVTDVHIFERMAEIGVILLMFSVGIEFSIPDLLRLKWVALAGAPLGIALSIGLGAGVGAMLGWT